MKSVKLICTNTSTIAFDNHTVTLEGDSHVVTLRYKDREDFENVKQGDEVTMSISETRASIAKDKPKGKGRGK